MTRKQKYSIAFLLFIYLTIGLVAKPRLVYLDRELNESKLIKYVEILDYTDTSIIFKIIGSSKILAAKNTFQGPIIGFTVKKYKTAYWPSKGEKVLIVIDKNNYVSLFAIIIGSNYLFWSPRQTMSTALFYFKKPAFKNPDIKEQASRPEHHPEYDACWENCFFPMDKLPIRRKP